MLIEEAADADLPVSSTVPVTEPARVEPRNEDALEETPEAAPDKEALGTPAAAREAPVDCAAGPARRGTAALKLLDKRAARAAAATAMVALAADA